MGEKDKRVVRINFDDIAVYEIPEDEVDFEENPESIPIPDWQDWFNVNGTRNSLNTSIEDYNCGGYCMNTFSWYNPYDMYIEDEGYGSMCDWLTDLLCYDYTREGLIEELMKIGQRKILSDFPDTARLIYNENDVRDNEKLVVFKVGVEIATESGVPYVDHADFHFKQWEGTFWSDKPGSAELRWESLGFYEGIYDAWEIPWWGKTAQGYCSEPIMFAVKKI